MILTVDAGNTNICLGVFDGDTLITESRIDTNTARMADQYAVMIRDILALYNVTPQQIDGAIISSVVPPVTSQLKAAVKNLFGVTPVMVGPGVKTGLNIKIDDPASLAADLCCTAVGAMSKYPLPAIIVDLGTATKITVVNEKREYIGGAIAPGVMVSLGALSKTAALLPTVGLSAKLDVIATETSSAMLSGSILGTASMLDGMIARFEKEIGEAKTIVACGGLAKVVVPHCEREIVVDKDLLLDGLIAIYKKNN